MNIKFLLKTLSFLLVTTFTLASKIDGCEEIKEYLEKRSYNYESIIQNCSSIFGNVTELDVVNKELKEEDVNKILSYDTIKRL